MSYTMTINEAKQQIKNTVSAYLKKDKYGDYIINIQKQRPVFLLGAPGIGKTSVISQIASELNINLVSYSMIHHTRQSALGLPVIETKNYGGKECKISDYTMSEIIASVYESMEKSGIKEGILFLDEINCVSETLAPAMLQFLQFKIFGKHRMPSGWVIVTAGNPSEYNASAKEFDIATFDRLKVMEIKPDYQAWKTYAYKKHIIPEIISFLDNRQHYFYLIEEDIDSKNYITPRGWEDLSDIIKIYKSLGIKIDRELIYQYIHLDKATEEFFIYYENFDYVNEVLSCENGEEIYNKMKKSNFNNIYAMLIAMIDKFASDCKHIEIDENIAEQLNFDIKKLFKLNKTSENEIETDLDIIKTEISTELRYEKNKITPDIDKIKIIRAVQGMMKTYHGDREEILESYNQQIEKISNNIDSNSQKACDYCDIIFETLEKLDNPEIYLTVFMREITLNEETFKFITENNLPYYNKYSYLLKLTEMQNRL